MNRRSFVTALTAGLIVPRSVRAQATPEPILPPRPEPIDLGSGITLVDYRLHPSSAVGLIGEIRNDLDQMIDAPVISLHTPEDSDAGAFTWLSPLLPVIYAGGSVPIFGPLPQQGANVTTLRRRSFSLCSSVEPGAFTAEAQSLDLEIIPIDEVVRSDVYRLKGALKNLGKSTARNVELRGILRDAQGRIAGMANSINYSAIKAASTVSFSIYAYADPQYSNAANPFPLLEGADYSAEIVAGPRGSLTRPGCEFGLPWE